jgi:hypothetical protein
MVSSLEGLATIGTSSDGRIWNNQHITFAEAFYRDVGVIVASLNRGRAYRHTFAESGREIFWAQQDRPDALAACYAAEIKMCWPVIKAARTNERD